MAEEVAMRGVPSVTVARVIARARVSRRLFYELFADVEDCFLATFDWGVEQARMLAVDAYTAEQSWREGIRAGLAAILRFFDERPLIAELCVVHAAGAGPRVLERRSLVIAELCEVVDRGRAVDSSSARALRTRRR
jgi:AcrR family transcriptional regulator